MISVLRRITGAYVSWALSPTDNGRHEATSFRVLPLSSFVSNELRTPIFLDRFLVLHPLRCSTSLFSPRGQPCPQPPSVMGSAAATSTHCCLPKCDALRSFVLRSSRNLHMRPSSTCMVCSASFPYLRTQPAPRNQPWPRVLPPCGCFLLPVRARFCLVARCTACAAGLQNHSDATSGGHEHVAHRAGARPRDAPAYVVDRRKNIQVQCEEERGGGGGGGTMT